MLSHLYSIISAILVYILTKGKDISALVFLRPEVSQVQIIQRAFDVLHSFFRDVRVNLGSFTAFVP